MLPDEIVDQLKNEYPCRETQIQHLAALYSRTLPSPPLLNIHGLTATGKSSIIRSYFALASLPYAIIYSKECITGRHLLERTVSSCLDALDEFYDEKADRRPYARTENLSALCVNLARMLEGRGRFTLVLDGIDKQREAPPTLLASLARLGEVIPNLSLILISTLALPINALHHFSIPTLHFPPYPRNSLIEILNQKPPKIFLTPPSTEFYSDYTPDLAAEDDQWLWNRFLSAVWDSLAKHSARDLISYRNTALRLWRPFVAPIISGQFGTRDFIRLMVNRRHLFQLEDPVLDRIIATSEVPMIDASNPDVVATTTPTAKKAPRTLAHDLPYYTTHLLIAAYLASYNPARTDATYFMKHTDKLKRKGKGKRGGTSTSTPSLPTHTTTSRSKHRKIPRHLLTPSPFPLDRLLAIFRALLDGPVPQTSDLLTQVATLTSMRLLVRAGAGAGDVLEPGTRWRVNFGWEYVRSLGRGVGVEVGEWLLGGG